MLKVKVVYVNAEKSRVGRPTGIKFLGFGYFAGKDGKYYARPHKKSYEKLNCKLKALMKRKLGSISLSIRLQQLKQLITGG